MILVTGANGFIGCALCAALEHAGRGLRRAVRSVDGGIVGTAKSLATNTRLLFPIGDIGPRTDWSQALCGVNAVIHLAGRVHIMREHERDPLAVFRSVNVDGCQRLAQMAAQAEVKRFIYVSSIKVNGEETNQWPLPGSFSESDVPHPVDPYAISKWEAEQALWRIASETGLEVVVVRPPLVYGPGVRANFLRILHWVNRGLPLPLAGINNSRSLIGVDNLMDFLLCCLEHPLAAGEAFLVADGEDLSTPDLIRRLARAMGKPARLFPSPLWTLRLAAKAIGKAEELRRLTGSLRVDSTKARTVLGWSPPLSIDEGIGKTVAWYKSSLA
jgi:nucleoside-diphosphate-sugar epimerase